MFDAEIFWFREAKAEKIKSHIDSIQVSHLHVARHGSIARLNRNAEELLAQKETMNLYSTQAVSKSIDCLLEALNAGFFCGYKARSERKRECTNEYMTD